MSEGKEEVKLLGVPASPFTLRAALALRLKKVPYELVPADPIEKSELLFKYNPIFKKIPVLLHGNRAICESIIIVEYIDTVWRHRGPPILPSDPFDTAMSRFWATYIDDIFFPSLKGVAVAKTAEEAAEAAQKLSASLRALEGALAECGKGKTFFGGDTIGFLDIALGGFMAYIRLRAAMSGTELMDKEKTPLLWKWVEAFGADEAAADVIPDNSVLIEFRQRLQATAAEPSA